MTNAHHITRNPQRSGNNVYVKPLKTRTPAQHSALFLQVPPANIPNAVVLESSLRESRSGDRREGLRQENSHADPK